MESAEEPFMSPGRGFMERFYQVVVGWLRDIEPIVEIEVSMLVYPILLVGAWKPGFSSFFIHSSKSFANNGV